MANAQDLQFSEQAATSGVTEIQLGMLAISSSPTFAVVQFAQQVVTDQTALDAQLASTMAAEKLPMPSAFSSQAVQSSIATQVNLSGPQSDEEYLNDMISGYQQDVANYQQETALGQDPPILRPGVVTNLKWGTEQRLDTPDLRTVWLPVTGDRVPAAAHDPGHTTRQSGGTE